MFMYSYVCVCVICAMCMAPPRCEVLTPTRQACVPASQACPSHVCSVVYSFVTVMLYPCVYTCQALPMLTAYSCLSYLLRSCACLLYGYKLMSFMLTDVWWVLPVRPQNRKVRSAPQCFERSRGTAARTEQACLNIEGRISLNGSPAEAACFLFSTTCTLGRPTREASHAQGPKPKGSSSQSPPLFTHRLCILPTSSFVSDACSYHLGDAVRR